LVDGITWGHPNHLLVVAACWGVVPVAVITGVRDEKGSATPLRWSLVPPHAESNGVGCLQAPSRKSARRGAPTHWFDRWMVRFPGHIYDG